MTEVVEKVLLALKGNSMSLLFIYCIKFCLFLTYCRKKKTDNKYCYIFHFGYYVPKKLILYKKTRTKKLKRFQV